MGRHQDDANNIDVLDDQGTDDQRKTDGESPSLPCAELKVTSLEPRILLSTTWVDADSGDPQAGATEGDDIFTGDNADNTADGLGGDDTLSGGKGDDTLSGGSGDDILYGEKHDDILDGGAGNDQLFGGDHQDILISGGGDDYMSGDKHDDTFRFDGAGDGDTITVDGGQHNDTIDLSSYSSSDLTDDGSTITVDLGGGESFTVNYSNVETILTSDGSFDPGDIGTGGGGGGGESPDTTYYLQSDGVTTASMSDDVPTDTSLDNHDPGRDSDEGLMVQKGGDGVDATDPTKYQLWKTDTSGVELEGPAQATIWTAMKDFTDDKTGIVDVYLVDCDASGDDCQIIAQGQINRAQGGGWSEETVDFGDVNHTVASGRSLALKIVVNDNSDDDMFFAYDATSYQSRLEFTTASDGSAPDAVDDSYTTDEDTPLTTGNVLANDTDLDGDSLSVDSFTQPVHGTVTYNNDGTFTYTPTANYHGSDSFHLHRLGRQRRHRHGDGESDGRRRERRA